MSFNLQERDVLIQLAQGSSNREIAQSLNVAEGTAKNYITQIFSKLGVRDRIQAALWAQKHLDSLISMQLHASAKLKLQFTTTTQHFSTQLFLKSLKIQDD